MKEAPQKTFDQFIHPYLFVLKEGIEIKSDFLDYSLLMLQVGEPDILYSPNHYKQNSSPAIQYLKHKS